MHDTKGNVYWGKAATEQGFPTKEHMSFHGANSCNCHGERGIFCVVPENTPQERPRIVACVEWGTVVILMHKRRVRVEQQAVVVC